MTTCVWDGEFICADTRSMTGSVIDQGPCQKVFQKRGVFCAISGDLAEAFIVVQRLLNPQKPTPDDVHLVEEGDWQIMLVSETRAEYYGGTMLPAPMAAPFAIGTGGNYALAALLAGKNGPQAIRLACKMDACSGVEFGIRKYKVREKDSSNGLPKKENIRHTNSRRANSKKKKAS